MKVCEACGQSFTCEGYGCWCGQVAITERQMDWIAAKFQGCLCPNCLQKVSCGELGPPPISAPIQPRPSGDPGA